MKLLHRLRALFRKEELDQELSDELAFHLEKQIEQNVAAGMSAEEARYAALRSFGGVEQVKEECRDAWGVRFIDTLLQDIRFGLRMLAKNPGFTAVAVLTLALGIGANTAIFSVVDAVASASASLQGPKPLGVHLRVLAAGDTLSGRCPAPTSPTGASMTGSSDGLAAYGGGAEMNLTSPGEPERLLGAKVTWDFFPLLGVQPSLGRGFLREEDRPGGRPMVLLSHELWRRRFGSDPKVVGTSLQLDGDAAHHRRSYTCGFPIP